MRSVWLLTMTFVGIAWACLPMLRAQERGGFEDIFDGKSLNGWRGKPGFWSVSDGAITGETTQQNPIDRNTFLIFDKTASDFELRAKVRILAGNSGIQFRSVDLGDFVVHGYQTDVDSTEKYLGDLYDEGGRGILAKGGDKVEIDEDGKKVVIGKTGDRRKILGAVRWKKWNDYRVIVRGNRIIQKINGILTVDVVDRDKNARRDGILALQLHAGVPMLVQFKNLELKKF